MVVTVYTITNTKIIYIYGQDKPQNEIDCQNHEAYNFTRYMLIMKYISNI